MRSPARSASGDGGDGGDGGGDGAEVEPGLAQFLRDRSLSDGATEEEIAFLQHLELPGRRPTPLFYYRELQNLRDPLHFHDDSGDGDGAR